MILDTNALSAVADGDPRVVVEFSRATRIAIPVIVVGEYRFGIAQSHRNSEYQRWLEEMLAACRVLEVSEETARHYAAIRLELKQAGTPIPSRCLDRRTLPTARLARSQSRRALRPHQGAAAA